MLKYIVIQIIIILFTFYIYAFVADAFIQSDLQCIQIIYLLSVYVFPWNWTLDLCAANAMLYHWATGIFIRKKV